MAFVAISTGAGLAIAGITTLGGAAISAFANDAAADRAASGAERNAQMQLEAARVAGGQINEASDRALAAIQDKMADARGIALYFSEEAKKIAATSGQAAAAAYEAKAREAIAVYQQYAQQAQATIKQAAAEATANAEKYAAEAQRVAQLYGREAAATIEAKANEAKALAAQYNERAQATLDVVKEENAPGQNYLRKVVADEGDLTPAQKAALDRLRLSTGNSIRTSSIAGSGRTAASLLRATESDFVNDALEKNRGRAMEAAGAMAGRANQADMTSAGLDVSSGATQAGIVNSSGQAQGGIINNIGTTSAGILTNAGNQTTNIIKGAGDSTAGILMNTGGATAGITNNIGSKTADILTNVGNQQTAITNQIGSQLGSMEASEGTQRANIENTRGTNLGNLTTGAARAAGGSVQRAAEIDANATIANGRIAGEAIGSIGSAINQQARNSRYSGLRDGSFMPDSNPDLYEYV